MHGCGPFFRYVPATAPNESGLETILTGESGTSGTRNTRGQIVSGDPNPALSHVNAFGTGPNWGEWETLARTDPDINSALGFVVAPIRDAILDVKPAEHPLISKADAQRHADFVKYNLTDFLSSRWVEFVQQAVKGSLSSGFAIHEKVYDVCHHPLLPNGVGYGVRKLAERLPSTVLVNGWREGLNDDGEVDLKEVIQQGQKYTAGDSWTFRSDIVLPANKILLTTWDRTGNNYAGYSAFRPVYYLAKIRAALARIIAIGHEREALGVPVAHGTTALNTEQFKILQQAVQGLTYHEAASVVMPQGWTLEFLCSPAADKSHVIEAYNTLGTIILRQLGAQMLAIGTTDNTGNRSLGDMHTGNAGQFIQGVVSMLEGVVNGSRPYNGLARSIVAPNWGEQPAYPVITLTLKKSELNVPQKIDAIVKAAAGGVIRITDADEIAMREMVGLPTELLTSREEDAAKAETKPAEQPPEDKGKPGEPVTKGETKRKLSDLGAPNRPGEIEAAYAKGVFRFGASAFVPARELRPSEQCLNMAQLVDYLGFASTAGSAVKSFETQARPIVADMLVKALPAIKAAMADGDPSEVATLKLDTSRLAPMVAKYLTDVEQEGYRQARNEKAKHEGKGILKERADGLPGVKMAADGSGVVKKAQASVTVRRIVSRLQEAIDQEAVEVIRTGGEATEVIGNVLNRQLDSAAFRSEAQLITTRAFNTGREQFAEDNAGQIAGVEYSAILDSATCDPCQSLDGQVWDFGSAEHDANVPPNRNCEGMGRCRCVLIFRWKTGAEE